MFIPFSLPGMNEIINKNRTNRHAGAKQKLQYDHAIVAILRSKGFRHQFKRVKVHFRWVEKNRRRDPDNIAAGKKFVMDALQAAGVIENDGWRQIVGYSDSFVVDKEQPGVWVTLMEVV